MEIAVEYPGSNMSDLRKTCIPMMPITDRLFLAVHKAVLRRFARILPWRQLKYFIFYIDKNSGYKYFFLS